MFTLKKIYVSDIPVLILYKEETKAELLPIIFLFHKLLQNKTNELPLAFTLAEQGYFVVIIDMVSHGERKPEKNKLEYNFSYLFDDIYQTAKDVEKVVDYLCINYKNKLDFMNMTAIGVSIGASVALASSCIINSMTRVACLVGSVNWEFMITHKMLSAFSIFYPANSSLDMNILESARKKYEPFICLKPSNLPSIIFLNGLLDSSLLLQASRSYYNKMLEIYDNSDERNKITFIELKKTGHEVNDVIIEHLLQWLLLTSVN